MRTLLLLLLSGAAACARPRAPYGQDYPSEYRPSTDYELQYLQPSRDGYPEGPLRTNRPRHEVLEVQQGEQGDGLKINTNAALQEVKKRQHETIRHKGQSETPLAGEIGSSKTTDDQESTFAWGSDPGDSKNSTDDWDDRTSIAGANCPTGQVKIEGKCVVKH